MGTFLTFMSVTWGRMWRDVTPMRSGMAYKKERLIRYTGGDQYNR